MELETGGDAPLAWSVRRDGAGRCERLEAPGGHVVSVDHGPDGDARSVSVDDVAWTFERDGFGRITSVQRGEGVSSLSRDPLGRAFEQRVQEPGGAAFAVRIDPLDDSHGGDTTLAEALGVMRDGDASTEHPPGSVRVDVEVDGGGRLVGYDELRTDLGRLDAVRGFWGTTGATAPGDLDVSVDPTLLEGSGLQPASDAIGDVLGSMLDPADASLLPLRWGGERLRSADSVLLPSPTGRGVGAAVTGGVGYLRLAGASGGTVTWLGPGASIDGLRLPGPSGSWLTPTGWLGQPTPGGGPDPEVRGALEPAPSAGPAAAVEAWWAGFSPNPDDLAVLPPALAVGARAWTRPRLDQHALAADLPSQEPPTDAGAALPPVPGLDRLLPGRRGGRTVTVLEALALSGDLPASSAAHRLWLDAPSEWSLWLPGAALLASLAERRATPSSPPASVFGGLAGASPALDGLLTDAGRVWQASVPDDAPHLAVRGLPAGTPPLRPGQVGLLPGARESIPGEARAPAIHALSDDPLLPGAHRREVARADGILLALHALSSGGRLATSPWLRPASDREAWLLETPAGTRVVIDGRGQLLSMAARAREGEAWRRLATAHAGRAALHPSTPLSELRALEAPAWLPGPSDRPESRWGLAPVDPERPLTALGAPALPGLIGAQDPDLGPLDVWRLLPAATAPPGGRSGGAL